jgi:heptosyltransferase-3
MKTFIYHDGALGDLLLSLPCLKALKASGRIHLAARSDVARFLREAGVVDAAVSSGQALFSSLYSSIDSRLRAFLSGFDRAYVFSSEENPASAAAMRTVIPHTVAVRTIPPEGSRTHAARFRLSQLHSEGLLSEEFAMLNVPPEKRKAAQSLLREAGYNPGRRLIAVHPGSGGRSKRWPFDRYCELIEGLQSDGDAFVVLFTGDAEERDLRDEVRRIARDRKSVLHADGMELMTAAALLSYCCLYIGNDSGFSHLAGMLACTTIVLFGPTDPVVWKPLGPAVEVVSTCAIGPVTQITAGDVIAKIESSFVRGRTLNRGIVERGSFSALMRKG